MPPPNTSGLGFNIFVLDKDAIRELRNVGREFSELRRSVQRLNGTRARVRVETRTVKARRDINRLISRMDAIAGRRILVNVAVATAPALLETLATIGAGALGVGAAMTTAAASVGAFGAIATPILSDVKDAADVLVDNTEDHEKAVSALKVAQAEYNRLGTEEALDRLKDAQEDVVDVERDRKVILGTLDAQQRGFIKRLATLQKAWKDLQDELSADVFEVATAGVKSAVVFLPALETLAKAAATPLKVIAQAIGEFGRSERFQEFVDTLARAAPGQIINLAAVFINLTRAAMGLIEAFLPLGTDASNALVQFTDRFARWAEQLRGDPAFQEFVARVRKNAPLVMDTLSALALLALEFSHALAELAPPMLRVIRDIAVMTERFFEAHPRITRFIAIAVVGTAAIRALTRPIRSLGITIRALMGAFVIARTGIKILISSLNALRLAFLTNPVGIIITALVALGVAFVIAYRRSETFRNIVHAVLRAVGNAARFVWNRALKPFFNFLKEAFSGGAGSAKVLSGVMTAVFRAIARVIGSVVGFVRRHFKTLLLFLGPAGLIVRGILFLRKNWDKIWAAISQVFRRTVAALGRLFGNVLSFVGPTGFIVKAILFLHRNWRRIWTAVGEILGRAARRVIDALRRLRNRIVGWAGDAIRWLRDAGRDIINGLTRGIVRAMRGIRNWLRDNVWDPIVSGVKALFGIKSPSSVFANLGFQMIRGLVKGLIRGNAAAFVKKVFGGLTDAAMTALTWLVTHGQVALEALAGLASDVLGKLGGLFGGGGSSSANMALGQRMAAALGWVGVQWRALRELWTRESGWRHTARNPSSGAYGIPQSLPASKMAAAGPDWRTNPVTQIRWGLSYIAGRYGTPTAALAWHDRHNWYQRGSFRVPETGPAVVHRDEMILPARLAESVRGALAADAGRREVNVNVGPVVVSDAADAAMLASRLAFDLRTASF